MSRVHRIPSHPSSECRRLFAGSSPQPPQGPPAPLILLPPSGPTLRGLPWLATPRRARRVFLTGTNPLLQTFPPNTAPRSARPVTGSSFLSLQRKVCGLRGSPPSLRSPNSPRRLREQSGLRSGFTPNRSTRTPIPRSRGQIPPPHSSPSAPPPRPCSHPRGSGAASRFPPPPSSEPR